MGSRQTDDLLHGLCKLAETQAQLTDGQLLSRFAAERDERAFAALLQRHGALVYGVCRNVLRHDQDAEDAFQGTFLVLARLAGTIRDEKALGGWLYRVAYRVAMKARRAAARRRRREVEAAKDVEERPSGELAWRELQAMLDEELNRLPEKYRLPFVLCCLSGMSKSEAAAELGWKEGTVSSRLAQARERLRVRLARRGVALSAILSGLAIARIATAVPPALLESTQRAAPAFAAGDVSAAARVGEGAPASFAHAVVRGMALARLKVAAGLAALVALVALAGGAAAVVLYKPPAPNPAPVVAAPPRAPEPAAEDEPAPGTTVTVAGTVVGPDGKPVPGARVAALTMTSRRLGDPFPGRLGVRTLREGRADDRGRFRLAVPRVPGGYYRLTVVAGAPGFGPSDNVAEAAADGDEHTLPIQLPPGQAVRVRLVGPDGKPVKGVRPHVLGLRRDGPDGVLMFQHEPPVTIPGWPAPAATDDQGTFTLRDIGPQTQVTLQVRDERFAPAWLTFTTGPAENAEPVALTLPAARVLEGRLTAQDTGKPLPGATVLAEVTVPDGPFGYAEAKTDADGRYRLRPFPEKTLRLWVYPPPGSPYLCLRQDVEWPAGAERHTTDVVAPPGVLVRGTVQEAGSGRRLAGAAVRYEWSFSGNPFRKQSRARPGVEWQLHETRTGPDGVFSMAVPPGPGALLVKAAEPDYLHVETTSGQLLDGAKTGGTPYFPDALVRLSPQPGADVQRPTIELRRGVTLRGRVVGSDGKPVPSAVLICPTFIPTGIDLKPRPVPVRDGRFELPGCEPGARVSVWVFDAGKKEGAVAELAAPEAAKPGAEPEVKLAPCVSARLRVVDQAGKPVPAPRLMIDLVFRPGDEINESLQKGTTPGLAGWTLLLFGRDHEPSAGAAPGEMLLKDLIPNARYSVRCQEVLGWPPKMTFTAPAAGTRDLGQVAIKPRGP